MQAQNCEKLCGCNILPNPKDMKRCIVLSVILQCYPKSNCPLVCYTGTHSVSFVQWKYKMHLEKTQNQTEYSACPLRYLCHLFAGGNGERLVNKD